MVMMPNKRKKAMNLATWTLVFFVHWWGCYWKQKWGHILAKLLCTDSIFGVFVCHMLGLLKNVHVLLAIAASAIFELVSRKSKKHLYNHTTCMCFCTFILFSLTVPMEVSCVLVSFTLHTFQCSKWCRAQSPEMADCTVLAPSRQMLQHTPHVK